MTASLNTQTITVASVIRAAVDMLPDTHAAPLDEAAKTVSALVEALKQTWKVIDSAGLLNLSNGVQLGQTSWYVKACDARAESGAALLAAGEEL
jgi:predicted transcriptional regulator